MKQYFDIYIRQAGAILEALPWAEDGTLTGWHKLELPDKGAKFSLEGQKREIGDGTELSDGEVANFSGATLWVTSDEWDELREDFHNQKCDLVLYGHNAGMIVAVCYGMQMNISTILTSGESELITVSGTKTMSNAGADMYLFLEREETEGEVLMGIEITGELEAFSANEGEASASQYYNVKGIRLAERIDITASTGIELSTDEATWDNPISVAKDFDDKIYVRISEEAEGGEIDGKIAHASEGATSRNLAVSGTVAALTEMGLTISPAPGWYSGTQSVTIACDQAEATIHYTTDGSEPTGEDAEYSGAFNVAADATVKALAVLDGYSDTTASNAYKIALSESQTYYSAVVADGGAVMDEELVDNRIRTLKENNMWDALAAEWNPNYGIKTSADGSRTVIDKLYDLKGNHATGAGVNTSPKLAYDDELCRYVVACGKYGDGGAPANTLLTIPAGILNDRSSAYVETMARLQDNVTSTQHAIYFSTAGDSAQARLQLSKRAWNHATDPNKYYALMREANETTSSSIQTPAAYTSEEWKIIGALVNWRAQDAQIYENGISLEQEESDGGWTGGNTANSNALYSFLFSATASYAIGLIASVSVWTESLASGTAPVLTDRQIRANAEWVADTMLPGAEIYANDYYSLNKKNDSTIKVLDASGDIIVSDIGYYAEYGVTGNNARGIVNSGKDLTINADEIANFSEGDAVELHSGATNNSLMASTTIDYITNNTITLTDAMSAPIEEAYSQSRQIRKVTDNYTKLYNISVTAVAVTGGKDITITGNTSKAMVTISLACRDASPTMEMSIDTDYYAACKPFIERLALVSAVAASEIYAKNRQLDTANVAENVYLDKQGLKFGTGGRSAIIYHTPEMSSLELRGTTNTLWMNLDHMDDHHYRWLAATGETPAARRYRDYHQSEYTRGDSRTNSVAITFGVDAAIPRLMLNPSGYLATYIWTEHADGGTLDNHRATWFGNASITASANATSGFAHNNIPMTKSVFYNSNKEPAAGATSMTDPVDGAAFLAFLEDIRDNIGAEVVSHTASYKQDVIADLETMLAELQSNFNLKGWIDHSADYNREAICADGLDPESEYYIAELLQEYGVKYVWQYASEDNRCTSGGVGGAGAGDMFRTGEALDLRTPLYWRHPTRMQTFITWATNLFYSSTTTAAQWKAILTSDHLDALIANWGYVANHGYFVGSGATTGLMNNGALRSDFNDALVALATKRAAGLLNLTTIREIMDYLLALENVSFNIVSASTIEVTNNGTANITGLALAINDIGGVTVDSEEPDNKTAGDDTIFWFDLAADETKTIVVS